MADCIFVLAIIHLLLRLYGTRHTRISLSLIAQFFIGWLTIELAWFHSIAAVVFIGLTLIDWSGFNIFTMIGIGLSAYNGIKFYQLHQQGLQSRHDLNQSLKQGLGNDYLNSIIDERRNLLKSDDSRWKKPFSMYCSAIETVSNISYGPYERNTLELSKPCHSTKKPKPVMLQIHGGGWITGYGEHQGLPLRNKLVEAGWIFISINYRLSPANKFPDHLIDCKQALKWIKDNIHEYGGNPDFIMTTGGSAGGHLSSLLALTANKHQQILQPGFEDSDLTVQGCIPMYGVYDFKDRNNHRSDMPIIPFLEKTVMPERLEDSPELWDIASPIAQVHDTRPPFMVTHGELDTLSFIEDSNYFVNALKESSESICVYSKLSNAQHAYDIFYSPRCIYTIEAVHHFCEFIYSDYLKQQPQQVI